MPRTFKQHRDLSKIYSAFEVATKNTHRFDTIGEHSILVPITPDESQKPKLIVSGHQGDEPAGVGGLLEWCNRTDEVPSHIRIIPIISEESYINGTHNDDDGQNPNLELPSHAADELEPLIEESRELARICKGGYLSCQEDPDREMGYLLVWKNGGKHKMIDAMLKEMSSRFPIHKNGLVKGDEIEDRTTLGAFCVDLGAKMAITTETPGQGFSLPERIECQVSILDLFVQ